MLNNTEVLIDDGIVSPVLSPNPSSNQFQLSPKKASAMAWNTILTLRAAAGIGSDASSDDDDASDDAVTPPMSPVLSIPFSSQFRKLVQSHLPAPTQEDKQMTLQNLPQSCEAIWRLSGRERVVRLQKFDAGRLEEMLVNVLQWEPEWMQWPKPNWDEEKIRKHVQRIDQLNVTAEKQQKINAEMVATSRQRPTTIRAM